MKSRISFFNPGVSRNLLRRCWPLWAGYGALLLFLLPVALAKTVNWNAAVYPEYLNRLALQSAEVLLYVSFVMGILTAMVAFGYLYNSRSCGMMASLPLRRETLFVTVWLTGLAPMLLADLLAALAAGLLYLGRGLRLIVLLKWLAVAVGTNLAFYGFAVFCAMLTGSMIILPLVYVVLNLAAWVAENCLQALLNVLVYGFDAEGDLYLLGLSPLVELSTKLMIFADDWNQWDLSGLGWVLFYALAGLLLTALALLLYRKRRMESASDTVAIPVLKTVFRYCMALGTALVFSSVIYSILLGGAFHGRAAALLILALLLLGAALGWYAAEMLIRRTVRVFPGPWRGLAAVCAALLLFTCAAELDLFGYERRIPAPEEVKSVTVLAAGRRKLVEQESIEKALTLHRSLVDHKSRHEGDIHVYGHRVELSYELADGSTLKRSYYLASWESGTVSDATDLHLLEDLMNAPEARRLRNTPEIPVTENTVQRAYFTRTMYDGEGREASEVLNLTTAEALDFYENCVLPDLEQGTLGRWWRVYDERYRSTVSNVSFTMELSQPREDPSMGRDWDTLSLQLCMDSENCLRWLREHSDVPVVSQADTEPEVLPQEYPVATALP